MVADDEANEDRGNTDTGGKHHHCGNTANEQRKQVIRELQKSKGVKT